MTDVDENDDLDLQNSPGNLEVAESDLSALKDNIAKKGKNAYYYAHGHGANGPVWDGKEEPRLLCSEKSDGSTKEKSVKEFASYAWADQTNSVKIYIDYEGADQIEENDINVWNTVTSLEFTVQRPDVDYKLVVPALNNNIDTVTYKKKSDKFVLTLKKATVTGWFDLKKK